jgi:hypothetical protein
MTANANIWPGAAGSAARAREEADIVRDIHCAARAIATTTASWPTLHPTPGALEDARIAVAGLTACMRELAAAQRGADG